eukprot:4631-Prorocentrum_minimum.AAC.1
MCYESLLDENQTDSRVASARWTVFAPSSGLFARVCSHRVRACLLGFVRTCEDAAGEGAVGEPHEAEAVARLHGVVLVHAVHQREVVLQAHRPRAPQLVARLQPPTPTRSHKLSLIHI